jgi:hypothetical protein
MLLKKEKSVASAGNRTPGSSIADPVSYSLDNSIMRPHESCTGGYTRASSSQRLGKHVPIATNRRSTTDILLEAGVSMWSVVRIYLQDNLGGQINIVRETVKTGLERGSWRKSVLEAVCQGTAVKGTAGCMRLSRCCGDLWIVEISGGALITCCTETWVYKCLINPLTNPNPVYSHTHTRDSMN